MKSGSYDGPQWGCLTFTYISRNRYQRCLGMTAGGGESVSRAGAGGAGGAVVRAFKSFLLRPPPQISPISPIRAGPSRQNTDIVSLRSTSVWRIPKGSAPTELQLAPPTTHLVNAVSSHLLAYFWKHCLTSLPQADHHHPRRADYYSSTTGDR